MECWWIWAVNNGDVTSKDGEHLVDLTSKCYDYDGNQYVMILAG